MNNFVAAYLSRMRAGGYSDHTIDDRRMLLCRLDRELPEGIARVSTVDLEAWLAPYRGWTLYTYYEAIAGFYRFLTDRQMISHDPASGLLRPRTPRHEPRAATQDQLERALQVLPFNLALAVLLADRQGLRCTEIRHLERRHVSEEYLHVKRKGGRQQSLPTHASVWEVVAGMTGLVVPNRLGQVYTRPGLSNAISKRLSAAGMVDLTLHRFRAKYATDLSNSGVPARVIQDLMGHSDLNTTQAYIAVSSEQRRLAVTTLPAPNTRILLRAV